MEINSDVEKSNRVSIPFRAEIRQLLNILIHSLYTEREIFLRELLSNASDALNRVRFVMLTNHTVVNPDAELCINIQIDPERKILRIKDSGIGMTRDELAENLGMIAHSGVRNFIEATQRNGASLEGKHLSDVIGQFGVGFYSVFMVAEWVRVISRSYLPEAKAAAWYATGGETFTIEPSDKEDRGTEVEIKLKDDATEFLNENRIREIVKKHSDYLGFPIYWGDSREPLNRQTALWREKPHTVEEKQYTDFYRQLLLASDQPILYTHVYTDAPMQVYALLFVPGHIEKGILSLRKDYGLKLYARKVLIQDHCKDLLPEYLRFVEGVVDSEDLPLNVSRESVQSNVVMTRLKKILAGKILMEIKECAIKNPQKYETFWGLYGSFIKEGIASIVDESERETLYPLLRFRTTTFPEQWSSLDNYISRMRGGQKTIYYLLGDEPRSIMRSPHLDYFLRNGYEVITLTDPIDSFMVLGLGSYEGFDFKNCASVDIQLPGAEEHKKAEDTTFEDDVHKVIKLFKDVLGDKVADVKVTDRLSDSVARLVDAKGTMNLELQRVYRLIGEQFETPKKVLEINIKHPILKAMSEHLADESCREIIEQIYENALLIEGLHPDPAAMIPRIQRLMEAAMKGL